jgi:hypothetical protein
MSTAAFVFYMFMVTDSIWNDHFSTNLSRISCCLASILFGIVVFVRMFQGCLAGSKANISERFSAASSLICPGLKYHVARKNPNYEGRISTNLRLDVICNVIQIVAGIFAEIGAGNAYYVRWWYNDTPDYQHDNYPLFFGIFLLVESVLLFSVSILIHGKWISKTREEEKAR